MPETTDATGLIRGTPEWRREVLRVAAECDRIGIPAAAAQLRMIEFTTVQEVTDAD